MAQRLTKKPEIKAVETTKASTPEKPSDPLIPLLQQIRLPEGYSLRYFPAYETVCLYHGNTMVRSHFPAAQFLAENGIQR